MRLNSLVMIYADRDSLTALIVIPLEDLHHRRDHISIRHLGEISVNLGEYSPQGEYFS